jgi:hypothetical protein
MLAETTDANTFKLMASSAATAELPARSSDWRFRRTSELCSLIAYRDSRRLIVIAGRQIVTAERVEVLALGTHHTFSEGLSMMATIRQAAAVGALVVLPWGVGKWIGQRGRLVRHAIESTDTSVHLGDNSGRPRFWPRPSLFDIARERGLRVLPGTDPLPLPGEGRRVGSFGFGACATLSAETPAEELKLLISDRNRPMFAFGRLETARRFLRNQALLRLRR